MLVGYNPSNDEQGDEVRGVSSYHGTPATMPIGAVAYRTGAPTSTLRAWEHRYGLLRPTRTSGGHRRYSDQDVQRVLAVLELAARGWAVGAAARRVAGHGSGELLAPVEVEQLRTRVWRALEEAFGDLPAHARAPEPADEAPVTGQADAGGGVLEANAAASGGSGGAAAVRQRRRTQPVAAAEQSDWDILQAAHQATRALLYITTAREATDILVDVVGRLGGSTAPADQAGSWALPIDLTFGEDEPILPVAEPLSVARLQLEQLLPGLVEDARRAVALVRRLEDLGGEGTARS
jgi:DNA-binding transcriptional MerR regulator